jgi:hypothetical protein
MTCLGRRQPSKLANAWWQRYDVHVVGLLARLEPTAVLCTRRQDDDLAVIAAGQKQVDLSKGRGRGKL